MLSQTPPGPTLSTCAVALPTNGKSNSALNTSMNHWSRPHSRRLRRRPSGPSAVCRARTAPA